MKRIVIVAAVSTALWLLITWRVRRTEPVVHHEPVKPGDIMKVDDSGQAYFTNVIRFYTPRLPEPRLIRFELGENSAVNIDERYLGAISNWVRTNWIEPVIKR